MKKYSLTGKNRTVVGKKVKNLRKLGELPATIYGKTRASETISVAKDAFETVYKAAGETGLIELNVEHETHPVLVHTVQIDPVSGVLLHVEFHQVDLKEKVHAKIPLETTGESPAVAQKLGVLLIVHDSIEVEALPTDLPEKIMIDVGKLAEVNQETAVSDIVVPRGVTILTEQSLILVKVGPLVTKEAEAQAATEAAEAAEAAATTETAPAAGAQPEQPSGETPKNNPQEK